MKRPQLYEDSVTGQPAIPTLAERRGRTVLPWLKVAAGGVAMRDPLQLMLHLERVNAIAFHQQLYDWFGEQFVKRRLMRSTGPRVTAHHDLH